jgi:hypothetical protein
MNCTVLKLADLSAADLRDIEQRLTKHDSVFQRKLQAGERPGHIAIVKDGNELLGWARSETWDMSATLSLQTLESFVAPGFRRHGIAAFASAGLKARRVFPSDVIAVFHPAMLLIAKSIGLLPMIFQRNESGEWLMI